MASRASIAKHPIHPMLIAFPIGLWIFSLVCDIVYWAGGGAPWDTVSKYAIAGGCIGALLAAVPGFIDLLSMPSKTRIKTIGTWHMSLNLGALALFAISFFIRNGLPAGTETVAPFVLSIIGVATVFVSGWLGGAMVYEYGMAVETEEKPVVPEEPTIRRAA